MSVMAIFSLMSFMLPDFFSSMTKVDYVEGNKTLKFTTKMNTEHVSSALKINPNTAGFEAEVKKYVNRNFDVVVNGATLTIFPRLFLCVGQYL